MELQDTVRLRERPNKRNRDRGDVLNRNKRRRGSFNKDDGEESTEESVENDEEDYEVDDAGLTNRMLSPSTAGSPSSPLNYSGHRRNYLPMRVAKQAMPLKVSDEIIGVVVPRKARSGTVVWLFFFFLLSVEFFIGGICFKLLLCFFVFLQLLQNGPMIMGLPAAAAAESWKTRVIVRGRIRRRR